MPKFDTHIIKSAREAKELTQPELASKAGISEKSVWNAEAGHNVSEKIKIKILQTLELSEEAILPQIRPAKDIGYIDSPWLDYSDNNAITITWKANKVKDELSDLQDLIEAVVRGQHYNKPAQFHITAVKPDTGRTREFVQILGTFKDTVKKIADNYEGDHFIESPSDVIGKKRSFDLDSLHSSLTREIELMEQYRELRLLGFHFLHGQQFVKQYIAIDHFFLDEVEQETLFYKASSFDPFKWPGSFKQFYTLRQEDPDKEYSYLMECKPARETAKETEGDSLPYPHTKTEKKWMQEIDLWEMHQWEKAQEVAQDYQYEEYLKGTEDTADDYGYEEND